MNDYPFTFDPLLGNLPNVVTTATLIAVPALLAVILLLRNPGKRAVYRRNTLLALLAFVLFLVATGTALFNWLAIRKIQPVIVEADRVTTGYGTVAYADIRRVYVDQRRSSTLPGSGSSTTHRALVIEEVNGKRHLLPENFYPTGVILDRLRMALGGKAE